MSVVSDEPQPPRDARSWAKSGAHLKVGLTLGGHRQEDVFWDRTLTTLAAHFGHEAVVETQVICVDRRRQWGRWRNVWQSAAIRTTVYTVSAPARRLRRRG